MQNMISLSKASSKLTHTEGVRVEKEKEKAEERPKQSCCGKHICFQGHANQQWTF